MHLSSTNYCHVGSGNVSVRQRSRLTFDSSDEEFFSSSESDTSSSSDDDLFSSGDDDVSSISSASYHNKYSNDSVAGSSKARMPSSELIANDKLWPFDKDHINVYFMNGSTAEQWLVKYLVRKHYNSLPLRIQFNFLWQGELYRSDIRLEFARESWSYIGTNTQSYPGQKTMRLNLHPVRSTEEAIRAKVQADVLHEFGHALGMVHAHKHPDCKANWNYQKLVSDSEWTLEKVRRNYDKNTPSVVGKIWDLPYDPHSIMHYVIRKGDTHSCLTEVEENTVLSDGDKRMLLSRYLKRREEKETKTRTKTRHEVSKKLVSIPEKKPKKLVDKKSVSPPKEKHKQEPRVCSPVYVSGNSSSTVRGGYVVVSGNASATVKGGGYVVVSGNGGAIVYGDSNVRVSGNGTAVVSGNGSARFSGRGTGKTTGNGSISSYV
ncbi:hypothetical protein HD806DRAFT_501500 [Xylariaceae sp. AK1471]|nr:hypothetical protein HD806DRAFT_501500 [Xylariaceae sp. AK1471]